MKRAEELESGAPFLSPRLFAPLYVLVASAAFATSGPLAGLARPADPTTVAAGRLIVAALVLFALFHSKTLASIRRLSAGDRRRVGVTGAILGAHFAFFLEGLDQTSLAAAVSLVSLEPLAVLVSAWAMHKLRPTGLEALGIGAATLGAIVVAQGAGEGDHRLFGDLLVLVAVVLFGVYVASARTLRDALPVEAYVTAVYAAAAVVLCAFVGGRALVAGALPTLPADSLLFIVLLGLIPTVLGHTLLNSAARSLRPAIVALVSPGETVGAIGLGMLWLGTYPTTTEATGALLILCGVVAAVVGGLSTRRHPPTAGLQSESEGGGGAAAALSRGDGRAASTAASEERRVPRAPRRR